MPICPECDGKGVSEIQISEYWEEPIRYEKLRCRECGGSGLLSRLELSIYNARGGTASFGGINGYA